MKNNLLFLLIILVVNSFARLNVNSFNPVNGKANVSLEAYLSVTYSESVDADGINPWIYLNRSGIMQSHTNKMILLNSL
jgi:hypothetical protein